MSDATTEGEGLQAYRPSGAADPGAGPRLLLVACGVGLGIGALAHVIGAYFRLLILFPLLMGLAVGAATAFVVKRWRVRAPLVATVAGVLGGVCAFGADLGSGYFAVRADLRQAMEHVRASLERGRGAPVDPAGVERATDAALVLLGAGRDPDPSLEAALLGEAVTLEDGTKVEPPPPASPLDLGRAYLDLLARNGTKIGRGGSDKGIDLGDTGTRVLWLLELALLCGVAVSTARGAARAPFCEDTGRWFDEAATVVPVGPATRQDDALAALERGDGRRLARLLGAEPLPAQVLALALRRAGEGAPRVHVELLRIDTAKAKDGTKRLRDGLLPAATIDAFLEEVARIEAARQGDLARKAERKQRAPGEGGADDAAAG